MSGRLSDSRSGRTLLMCSRACWLNRPRKSTFFALNALFWEKATLLHAVFHSGKMPLRLSRHHYDLARLYWHEYGQLAMKDFGLLASVVEHKKIFFREAAARYDLAKPGSLRVCPPDVHVAQIRSDYRDMREMFFTEAPPFDTVMADLRELEERVNR